MTEIHKVEAGDNGPRHQEYRKLLSTFRPGDKICDLLKQLEQMWDDDEIYLKDRAAIFRKCVGDEIGKVIESAPTERLGNYQFLKQQMICHFKGMEEGASNDFGQLHFRTAKSFSEYEAEAESSLEALLKVTKIGTNYKMLHDTMIRHKLLSMIPDEMSEFLLQGKLYSLMTLKRMSQNILR